MPAASRIASALKDLTLGKLPELVTSVETRFRPIAFQRAALEQVNHVRKYRPSGGGMHERRQVAVHARHHLGDALDPLRDALEDLLLALLAVLDERAHERLGVEHRRSMRGQQRAV